jgi:hypothetical protein
MKFFGLLLWVWLLPAGADDHSPLHIWQTVPFLKGQDLCQFQDAFGSNAQEAHKNLSQQLINLLYAGADPAQLLELMQALDRDTQQNRARAAAGNGMDVLLEGSLKAALDARYAQMQPRVRNITFFNPAPIYAVARELRDQKRQGYLDASMLGPLNAMAWGTYSYAPACKGDLVVTLHIQVISGRTYNYQATGKPDQVMQVLGAQLFTAFQHTQFPSKVKMGQRSLELVGAPGVPIGQTTSAAAAERSCLSIQARLPAVDEYEYLAHLGDWNQGVALQGRVWALSHNQVLVPDLPNPSPVRTPSEVQSKDIHYYCVR